MEPSHEGLLASTNTVVGRTIVEGLLAAGSGDRRRPETKKRIGQNPIRDP